jgi:hypothetical protein
MRIRAQRNKHRVEADQPNFKETIDYGRWSTKAWGLYQQRYYSHR